MIYVWFVFLWWPVPLRLWYGADSFSAFFSNGKLVLQTFFKHAASESGVFELCPPLVRGAPLQCVVLASGPWHSSQWFTQLKEGMDG